MSRFRHYSKLLSKCCQMLRGWLTVLIDVSLVFYWINHQCSTKIKFKAWLQHLATGLRCCKLSTNVCDWAMLNHSESTIDRLKIIVKWGTFRPWRTLGHAIGGQSGLKILSLWRITDQVCLGQNGFFWHLWVVWKFLEARLGLMSVQDLHWLQRLGSCKASFGAKVV